MKTYKQRLEAGLLAMGYKQDFTDKSKYSAFINPQKPGNKLFVGNAGALRKGECASRSYSISDPTHQGPLYLRLLTEGDRVLRKSKPEDIALAEIMRGESQ